MTKTKKKKFKFKDPSYYLTLFTLEGHETWRVRLSTMKDGFDKDWEAMELFDGKPKPKITKKNVIRIDRITGQIIPLP